MADVLCRHYADVCIYHTDAEPGELGALFGPAGKGVGDLLAMDEFHGKKRLFGSEDMLFGHEQVR